MQDRYRTITVLMMFKLNKTSLASIKNKSDIKKTNESISIKT